MAPSASYTGASWDANGGVTEATVCPSQDRQWQRRLLQAITSNPTKRSVLRAVMQVVVEAVGPLGGYYFERDKDGQLSAFDWLSADGLGTDSSSPRPGDLEQLTVLCQRACDQSSVQVFAPTSEEEPKVVAVPVFLRADVPEVFCLFVSPDTHLAQCGAFVQMVASHITLWHVLQQAQHAEQEVRSSAALLEVLQKVEGCDDLRCAAFTLVNELRDFLGSECQRIALGIRRRGGCHLLAVSGLANFDRRSDFTNSIESALEEAIACDEFTTWPSQDDLQRHGRLAHEQLRSQSGAEAILSAPLCDQHGEAVGAWLFLSTREFAQRQSAANFIRACAPCVGSSLRLVQRAERGPLIGTFQKLKHQNSWRVKGALAAIGLTIALMLLPVRYKVSCDCEIQPVTRRIVAAPYEGRLDKTLVEPGDLVSEGSELARMDGREIRWQLAGLEAEYNRATKQRDMAMAKHEAGETQQAKLEMERLGLKIRLFEHRAEHLEIKSPLDGIVVSGDLKKVEGAPLTIGQSLFEIAPLNKMIVEVMVPEKEIAYVRTDCEVKFRVNAYPHRKWNGSIARIFPRSELREHESVFVAEVNLDNRDGQLFPGMKGRAKIITPRRPLGWVLFHKPADSLTLMLGW